jgi:phosphoserine phosphatase
VLQLLARHPARWWRVALLLLPVFAYLFGKHDRGALKGGIVHALLAGLSREHIAAFAKSYAQATVAQRMFPEAVAALRAHLAAGDHVVLLSASPDLYVPEIGRQLGVHETHCTMLRWHGDQLDGRLAGLNRRDAEKLRVLVQLRQQLPGLPVTAYGNSKADLDHLVHCEQGVYVNASPALAIQLTARGLRCVHWH